MQIKVTGQFVDKDLGMKNMLKLMSTLRDPRSLEVGLIEGTPQRAIKLGLWHEYGTRTNTPMRPWLSDSFDRYTDEWIKAWTKDFWTMYKNPAAGQTALHLQTRMGQRMAADIQNNVVSGNWTPNAESTIDKKGFDWPLVENGWFADQIKFKVHPPKAKARR